VAECITSGLRAGLPENQGLIPGGEPPPPPSSVVILTAVSRLQIHSSLTENTLRLHYKDRSVNAVREIVVYYEHHMKHMNTLCGQNAVSE
jgi:hypothetical protein